MKPIRLLPLLLPCTLLTGCALFTPPPPNPEPSVLRKSLDRAHDIETSSNINQINQMLSMVKSDNGGVAPATLEEAKKAAKVPAEMWIDTDTKLPLEYDPASGTVYRHGSVPNAPPVAGSAYGRRFNNPNATGTGGY